MKPVSDLSAALPILPPHGTEYRMSALTTLTAALSGQVNPNVNLVKPSTVGSSPCSRRPTTPSARFSPQTIDSLKTDSATLSLTYHVVPGRVDPANVVGTTRL
jgi:hypothetical protein